MKIWAVLGVVLLAACADVDRSPTVNVGGRDAASCQDDDGDGFGRDCELGGDCNDNDPEIHVGCLGCVRPNEGCACDETNQPVSCFLDTSTAADGTAMCHEGTRYCRNGAWSACESIFSYPKPAATQQSQAVLNPDAGLENCSDCRPNCYVVRDNLNPLDGGLGGNGNNTQVPDGGGLTLGTYIVDAGMVDTGPAYDAAACIIGAAPDKDCDGILDDYDPFPTEKPFATANPTIFLDLAAGATGTGVIDLAFNLNSVDVYFLIDQTTTMDGERDNLVAQLTTGDYVNDPNYDCADYDFDHQPNNELKNKGIIGAIRCYIRDANFGVGFFRELPFSTYADTDDIAYRNLQDITSDLPKLEAAVQKLEPIANNDFDEVAMPALHSVVTGNGMYFGTDRTSVPERSGCPMKTWGYPCFRDDAVPIVLLFTDAMSHNGPGPSLLRAYDSSKLKIASANTAQEVTMATGNETFATATNAGDLTSSYVSYAGNTSGMQANASAAAFSCSTNQSPDAFYRFSLGSKANVTVTTEGSNFNTVLGVWSGLPPTLTELPSYPNTNDVASNAYDFGNITNKYVQAAGNTSGAGLNSNYLAADLGCGSFAGGKDATFKFTLGSATRVALDTSGSSIGSSLSVFSGTPAPPAYTTVNDVNDTLGTAHNAGTLDGALKMYSGNTGAASISANYTAAQLGCGPADNAPDSVFRFTVGGGSTRRVRVSAEDSPLDTVLALTDDDGLTLATSMGPYTNNDSESENPVSIGALDGKAYTITGSTRTLDNNYGDIGCNASSSSRDAVFRFTLGSTRTVHMNTNSSATAFDTVMSLYKGSIGAGATTAVTGQTTYENQASAYALGTVNAKKFVVSGSTTSSMIADYSATQTGCGTVNASPDAVYKMSFSAPTRVRLDTTGSSFDTSISLHSRLPDDVTSTTISGGDTSASPYVVSGGVSNKNILLDHTTGTGNFDANTYVDNNGSCEAHDLSPDAFVSFNVGTAGTYEISTAGTTAFDTVLGIYTALPPSLPSSTNSGGNGDTVATAVNAGNIDGTWKSYTGNYSGANDSLNFTSGYTCGSHNSGRDVFYRFRVVSPRAVRIDTVGSTYDGSLALYSGTASAIGSALACNDNAVNTGGDMITTGTLAAGYYYVVLKGKTNGGGGAYQLSIKDNGLAAATTPTYCDDNGGGGTTSKITAALTVGTYYAVVKGKTATSRGAFKLAIKHLSWMNAFTPLACNDNVDGSTTASRIEYDIPAAGDYYVVLKGKSSGSSGYGAYKLNIQDVSVLPNGFISCDNDTVGTTSAITETLGAGTYWVVLKGRSGAWTTRGDYALNIFDTASTPANVITCDHSNGTGGTSLIETDLAPGNYRVIVKGRGSNEKNNYKLQLRDVTGLPLGTGRVACDYDGVGTTSYVETDLAAGTYTVVLKSDSASNGDYKLSVRDVTRTAPIASTACDDDSGSGSLSALTTSLAAGTYYVGVRGKTASDVGDFQVHFGAGAQTTDKYFVPKTYVDTVKALNAKKVHVLPILSCADDNSKYGTWVRADCPYARTQYEALATATNTMNSKGVPLVYDMSSDGSGLSKTVVGSIRELAKYLEMDVGVRVVFAPDANPGFGMSIKAVDKAGDGCKPPVAEVHQDCTPGATPRFEIKFTNPLNPSVPLNSLAKDPKGGYNFRAELIANESFIVDQVPIYIIPENVVNVPPPPQVHASGTYWQTLSGNGCAGKTDLPDWSDLTWSATVPSGTTVSFGACTADTAAASTMCTPTPICTITGGGACSATTPCPAGSFCSTGGNCHRITGGSCTTHADCFGSATCQSNVCVYNGQPVDVGAVLASQNLKPNLRVQIGLTANTQANIGPVVHDWSINYLCKSSL